MATGTMPDLDFYPTSPQPLVRSNNEIDQAGPESHDSVGEQGLHGGAEPLTNNSRAISTNGYEVSPTHPRSSSPDNFYKGFINSTHTADGSLRSESSKLPAAQQQSANAARSTSSGAAPKYPAILQSRNQPVKPSLRSASAPQGERAVPRVGRSAAVQDRIKMFDQKSGQASSIPRGTSNSGSPRIPYLTSPSSSTSSRTTRPGQATREPFSSRVTSPQAPRTQRPRFTVEDQHSNNVLASAARSSKQRSTSNATNETSWEGNMGTIGTNAVARPPLFGEIVTSESGSQIPYGISDRRGRTRRSVDSTINAAHRKTVKTQGQDSSPESPTEEWYRAGALDSRNSNSPDFPGKHARSMSDSYTQPMQPQGLFGALGPAQNLPEQKFQMKSRLPVMSKATASPSMSSDASTIRANSAMSKRAASDSKEYQSPGNRPYSPAGHVGYNGRGTRTQPRNLSKAPANIQAMITPLSAPLKSPPLRSSKIRLPVSSASTASSRSKMTNKAGPGRSRAASRASNGDESRPGASHFLGKPDFAARRARIQEGMHKRAEEIKEKEQEAHVRAEMAEAAERANENVNDEVSEENQATAHSELAALDNHQPDSEPEESPVLPQNGHTASHTRSPAFGMPGSFPISQRGSAGTPLSAVSAASIETLFDSELQTEPPTQQDVMHEEETRPLATSINHPLDHTLAHKSDVVNFSQRLAEAKIDLAGDMDRSHHYSEDESPVFPSYQPRSHESMRERESGDKVEPSMSRNHSSADISPRRSPLPAKGFSKPITSMDGSSEPRPVRAFSDNRIGEADDSIANNEVMERGARPSWQMHPTSPPRSSNSQLPKLQTSSNQLKPLNFSLQDNAMSAVTDIDGECSESSSESPRLSVEGIIKPRPVLQSQDGATDRKSHSSDSAFEVDNGAWPETRITEADINKVAYGGPPLPPKEPLEDQGPAVPPKSDGYTPLLTPRGDYPGAVKSYPSSNEYPSFRTRSNGASHVSSGPASANPSVHSFEQSNMAFVPANGSSTNLWDHTPSLPLTPYPADQNTRRESGDTGHFRPSTSTARSSAFISNGSDNADTPVSSNDQPDQPGIPHPDCPVRPQEFARIIQRKNHLMELVDTEAAFNKDMNVLVEIYQGTAVAVPDLTPDDIRVIFRNANQIIEVSRDFLADLKETTMPVYIHRSAKAKARTGESRQIGEHTAARLYPTLLSSEIVETRDNDLKTAVGEVFLKHIPAMFRAYTRFINGSSAANMRIQELSEKHPSIKVWLEECNDAASDLSAAWDLGSMLVKPMQRITKYPMMIQDLLKKTPEKEKDPKDKPNVSAGHPDRKALEDAYKQMDTIVKKINSDMARVETMLGALSDSRKKKDAPPSTNVLKRFMGVEKASDLSCLERNNEDKTFLFCNDRYHSEFARIEVVIRDIERYIAEVTEVTKDFLRLLSAIELVVRASPSSYPELESKWARFNLSMREIGSYRLDKHINHVKKSFLEPFVSLARAYVAVRPTIALRNKRRPKHCDYEKQKLDLTAKDKRDRAKLDDKFLKFSKEYIALNDTLTIELTRMSELNVKLMRMCFRGLICTQEEWWMAWTERLRTVVEFKDMTVDTEKLIEEYDRDSAPALERIKLMSLANGSFLAHARAKAGRSSESTIRDDDSSIKGKSRTSTSNHRSRGHSVNSEPRSLGFLSPHLRPTASEQSPSYSTANSSGWSLAQPNKRDTAQTNHGMDGAGSYDAARASHGYRSVTESRRTSTDSRQPRPSVDSYSLLPPGGARSPIADTQINPGGWVDGLPPQEPAFSDVFKSALPWSNSEDDVRPKEAVQTRDYMSESSDQNTVTNTAENRTRQLRWREGSAAVPAPTGPKALYVVASLEPFHIAETKTEGNYPYLTYEDGEIFDVVAEKGELWLARNQDDPLKKLGWIWNQHFARIGAA